MLALINPDWPLMVQEEVRTWIKGADMLSNGANQKPYRVNIDPAINAKPPRMDKLSWTAVQFYAIFTLWKKGEVRKKLEAHGKGWMWSPVAEFNDQGMEGTRNG